MDSLYNSIVFLHISGAFTFVPAHGVSAGVALKLRQERKVPRVQALLELSNTATQGTYLGLVILLIGGITAAFMAGLWGRGWIWTAIALLVVMIAFMYARASRYYDGEVRSAARPRLLNPRERLRRPDEPEHREAFATTCIGTCHRAPPVGAIGLLAIVWLMVMKPFLVRA